MTKLKPIYEELLLQFEETIRRQKAYFNQTCSKNGLPLSYDQWLVLEQVMKKQGIKQNMIARKIGKEPASVSRILNYLERKELIIKVNNEKNRRANKIYLTHSGYDMCEKVMAIYSDCMNKQFKGIYEREVSLIRGILDRVNQNELK